MKIVFFYSKCTERNAAPIPPITDLSPYEYEFLTFFVLTPSWLHGAVLGVNILNFEVN